ncbi:MAG: PQQ-binding-like beta-propeller repeat protein [Streptosporangiales bacterium]|nr:PQQ-binding-like beta-propeller repeat protein [Streptosporangiales bacterium]
MSAGGGYGGRPDDHPDYGRDYSRPDPRDPESDPWQQDDPADQWGQQPEQPGQWAGQQQAPWPPPWQQGEQPQHPPQQPQHPQQGYPQQPTPQQPSPQQPPPPQQPPSQYQQHQQSWPPPAPQQGDQWGQQQNQQQQYQGQQQWGGQPPHSRPQQPQQQPQHPQQPHPQQPPGAPQQHQQWSGGMQEQQWAARPPGWEDGAAPGQPQPPWQQWAGPRHGVPSRSRSRGGGGRKRLLLVGGGALVLALVVVLVVVLVVRGTGDEGTYEVAWEVPAAKGDGQLVDAYLAGDVLVRATTSGVSGYAVDDGKRAWQAKPPTGQQVCTISPPAPGNVAIAVTGPAKQGSDPGQCTEAAAIDVTSGKELWRKRLVAGTDAQTPTAAAAAVVQGVAVVSNGRVTAFDVNGGAQRWTVGPKDNANCHAGDLMASDDALVAFVDCAGKATSRQDDSLVSLSPTDGAGVWTAKVKNDKGEAAPSVVSVSPTVIRVQDEKGTAAQPAPAEFAVLDDQGKVTATFGAAGAGGDLDTTDVGRAPGFHGRYPLAVVGTTLVGLGRAESGSLSHAVGVDLTDGQRAWNKSLGAGANGAMVFGDGVSKSKATVYTAGSAEGQTWFSTVDAKSGTVTKSEVVTTISDGSALGQRLYVRSGETLLEVDVSAKGNPPAIRAYAPA